MLLPQLHDELARAATRPRAVRRVAGRTTQAVAAALITLLVSAPVARGQFPNHVVRASAHQSRESA